jgi:hypothetical protein
LFGLTETVREKVARSMKSKLLLQSLDLLGIIEKLIEHHDQLPDSLDMYRASAKASICSLLELLSGLFCELDLGNMNNRIEGEVGLEPASTEEAWETLPTFVALCQERIAQAALGRLSIPAMEMHVRSTTYFGFLLPEASD